jgi:hypothetical protein
MPSQEPTAQPTPSGCFFPSNMSFTIEVTVVFARIAKHVWHLSSRIWSLLPC